MEALALAAALFTTDVTVRESEAFALAGELGMFPPDLICAAREKLASEHLEWLRCREVVDCDISPSLPRLVVEQQQVCEAHLCLTVARDGRAALYRFDQSKWPPTFWELPADDESAKRLAAGMLRDLIGDDDYFAGRLPLPVTCQRQ